MKSEKPTPHAMHVDVASSGSQAGAGRTIEPADLAEDDDDEEDEAAALPLEAAAAVSEACRTIKQSASRESETDLIKASGMRRRSRKRFGASLADREATDDDEADADVDDDDADDDSADSAPPLDFFFFFLPSVEDPDAEAEAEDTAPPGGNRCEKR